MAVRQSKQGAPTPAQIGLPAPALFMIATYGVVVMAAFRYAAQLFYRLRHVPLGSVQQRGARWRPPLAWRQAPTEASR